MAAEVPSSHGSLREEAREAAGPEEPDGFDSDEFREWMRHRRTSDRARRRRAAEDSDDDEDRPKGKGGGGQPPEWDGVSVPFQDWLV